MGRRAATTAKARQALPKSGRRSSRPSPASSKRGKPSRPSRACGLPAKGIGTDALTYQWLRDGLPIPEAVGETYKITDSDDGRSLALRVTASADGVNDGVETTLPSPKVSATNAVEYTARPGISGEAPTVWGWTRVGFTVEADVLGTWSPGWMTVKLQWQADGVDIEGATAGSYRIRVADLGKTVTLKVTGSSDGVPTVSMSNTSTAVTPGFIEPTDEMMAGRRGQGRQHAQRGTQPGVVCRRRTRDSSLSVGAGRPRDRRSHRKHLHCRGRRQRALDPGQGHRYGLRVPAEHPDFAIHRHRRRRYGRERRGRHRRPASPRACPRNPSRNPPNRHPRDRTPTEQAPAEPASAEVAPVRQIPVVQPPARTSPAQGYVSAQAGGGNARPQAAVPVQAAVTGAVVPAEIIAAPTESAPVAPAPAATGSVAVAVGFVRTGGRH